MKTGVPLGAYTKKINKTCNKLTSQLVSSLGESRVIVPQVRVKSQVCVPKNKSSPSRVSDFLPSSPSQVEVGKFVTRVASQVESRDSSPIVWL